MMARYIRAIMADTSPMVLGTKKVENRCINIHFYLIISEAFYHVFISCSSVWLKKKEHLEVLRHCKSAGFDLKSRQSRELLEKKKFLMKCKWLDFYKKSFVEDWIRFFRPFLVFVPILDCNAKHRHPQKKKKNFPGFQILIKWLISQGFTVGAERPVDFSQLYHWEVG